MDRNGYTFYKGHPNGNGFGNGHPGGSGGYYDRPDTNGRPPEMLGSERPSDKAPRQQRSDDSHSVVSLDSQGKRKSFTRLITRFAEKTSMQGVPYINNAKLVVAKVLWSALLVIAIGMMTVHLWYLCNQFFAYPKITKVSLGYNNLDFPSITICNTNPIHKGRLDQIYGAEKLKDLIDDLKPENLVPNQFNDDYDPTDPYWQAGGGGGPGTGTVTPPPTGTGAGTPTPTPAATTSGTGGNAGGGTTRPPRPGKRKKRFISETDNVDISKYDPDYVDRDSEREFEDDEFDAPIDATAKIWDTFTSLFMDMPKDRRARIGHNITDMLLSCTFDGRTCDPGMFRKYQTASYGNCWTIDAKQFRVSVAGPNGGLSLTLYLEVTEYLEGLANGYGIRMLVHQPMTFPFPEEEGHFVSASFETNVGLRLVSVSREKSPYGECDPNIDSDFSNNFNLTYTRRACQTVCGLDAMVAECGCFDDVMEELAFKKNRTLKPCRTEPERRCRNRLNIEIARKQVNCYCPVPCHEIAYEKYFSSRQWPSDSYAKVLLEGVCENDPVVCKHIRDSVQDNRATKRSTRLAEDYNFLRLNIYYEDLNYESIEEEPEIETAQFASDVGGAVGLWIGLSILSMCEVFQLIVELCDYAFHKSCGERRHKNKRKHHKGRHADSDANERSRDSENGHKRDSERQWPHTHYGDVRDSPRNSPRLPRDVRDSPRNSPRLPHDRRDGRFGNLYGDYSEPYPHTAIPR